jgi:hypothetical protein
LLLLLLQLVLLTLLALLAPLLLLISLPRKGGISIIFPMSWLTCALLLHRISGALLLTSGSTVTPTTTGRTCFLSGRHILVADILVSFTGILLNYHLFSGNCRIIYPDLLVSAARSHTSGTPSAGMRGRGLAPQPRTGTSYRRNVLECPNTWVCLLKGLLLLGSFRQKLVKPGLLLTQCFVG